MRKDHFHLRGQSLIRLMTASVVCPAYILLGYNNAVLGGLLNLPSFLETFPSIDTVNTKGSVQAENARIQGKSTGSGINGIEYAKVSV